MSKLVIIDRCWSWKDERHICPYCWECDSRFNCAHPDGTEEINLVADTIPDWCPLLDCPIMEGTNTPGVRCRCAEDR